MAELYACHWCGQRLPERVLAPHERNHERRRDLSAEPDAGGTNH